MLDGRLISTVNGQSFGVGDLELISLSELRSRNVEGGPKGRLKVSLMQANVRQMHVDPCFGRALFQVASQFNLLEMVGPSVSPEDGVGRYERDLTQGPACAIAAGAATIYRNYFVPVGDAIGQTAERQIDGLAELGDELARLTGLPVGQLWHMHNGYALCRAGGLAAINQALSKLSPAARDNLRGRLRIGVHRDVEVTDGMTRPGPLVTQAFCSALPVAYSDLPRHQWEAFATLVLEAAYEATLLAGRENFRAGGSPIVLLTRLGGGAFGNGEAWIDAAILRGLRLARALPLDVRIVSYGPPTKALLDLVATAGRDLGQEF